jgi:hypothetical protein
MALEKKPSHTCIERVRHRPFPFPSFLIQPAKLLQLLDPSRLAVENTP